MLTLAGVADPDGPRRPHPRPRNRHRRSAHLARRQRKHRARQQSLGCCRLRHQGPRPRLARLLRRRRARQAGQPSSSGSPPPFTGESALVASAAARHLEGPPRLPPDRSHTPRGTSARPSPTSASTSSARSSPAPPQQRPRDQRATSSSSTARSATPSARSTPQRYFPPEARRPRSRRWSPTSSPPSARASKTSPGWPPPPRPKRCQARHAAGRHRLPRPLALLRRARDQARRPLRQSPPRRASSTTTTASRRIGKPTDRKEWSHDAADRQRRQPSARQRPQLPRRHPSAAVLRSQGPRRRQLRRHRHHHRPRNLPHLRHAKAPPSTPRAASATGGPTPTAPTSTPPPQRSPQQYDAYAPFPDLHVNGHQTLGENIADLAGLTAAYDAFHASLHGKPAPPSVDGLHAATSSSSSPSPRTRPARRAKPPCASRSSPTPTRPASTAPTPSATSTPGTRPLTSNPPTRSTWRRRIASTSGRATEFARPPPTSLLPFRNHARLAHPRRRPRHGVHLSPA